MRGARFCCDCLTTISYKVEPQPNRFSRGFDPTYDPVQRPGDVLAGINTKVGPGYGFHTGTQPAVDFPASIRVAVRIQAGGPIVQATPYDLLRGGKPNQNQRRPHSMSDVVG